MFILAVVDTECLHSQWWIQNVYISSGGYSVFILAVVDTECLHSQWWI